MPKIIDRRDTEDSIEGKRRFEEESKRFEKLESERLQA
ncbi:hypothetical protein MNBD_GAMMA03-400 [hydrothermal vent metagenome]|uniref:Uncharacterized protein n=1 Tax=hydrothermal vent metagenome TaxID=652676 RepID=A0A3B0VYN2_9ZZZZ